MVKKLSAEYLQKGIYAVSALIKTNIYQTEGALDRPMTSLRKNTVTVAYVPDSLVTKLAEKHNEPILYRIKKYEGENKDTAELKAKLLPTELPPLVGDSQERIATLNSASANLGKIIFEVDNEMVAVLYRDYIMQAGYSPSGESKLNF
jgi:hypothetical protein